MAISPSISKEGISFHPKYDSFNYAKAQSLKAWNWRPHIAHISLLSVITCPLTDKARHVTLR